MKLTEKHFKVFKKECKRWQKVFELNNWEIHFDWRDDKSSRASCTNSVSGYTSTMFLSEEWENYNKIIDKDVRIVAKHEMIHLLLERLYSAGDYRHVSQQELTEASEETVRKLEVIIK